MSRIGKQQIEIPKNTEVIITNDSIVVKGPLGELRKDLKPEVTLKIEDGKVIVTPKNENNPFMRALWGTYASHAKNMIEGVNKPYEKKIILEGVGYKMDAVGDTVVMSLGFSHPVKIKIPSDLKVSTEKNVMTVSGIDKERVGWFASKIRSNKKPEPYKGKGMRYVGEVIRRKQGKKTA